MDARRQRTSAWLGALGAIAALALSARPAAAEIAAVWALDDGTKVTATELSHPLKAGNGIFDPALPEIQIFGARNETVAFQVILEGGQAATANVRVRLDSIGPIQNQGLSADPDAYFIGRQIELFAEHYFDVVTRSHDLAWEPGSAAEPPGMTGWIPDALIPLGDSDTLTVPASRNQAVWVDVYIPRGTAPGSYASTISVEVEGTPCSLASCQIPITLQVLGATLPDEPAAKTMLYFSGGDNDRDQMYSRYSTDPWGDDTSVVEPYRLRHYKLGRRHRITMFIGDKDAPDQPLADRVAGTSFSLGAGYEGPGEDVGQDMYSIHTYGGTLSAAEAATWSDWFTANGPNVEYFLYTMDEPDSGDFATINAIAAEAAPVPAFVTHGPAAGLEVSIYCAGASAYSIDGASMARYEGKRVWIYNGTRPFTGTFVTDDVAVSTRVNPWIQYKYEIPRWFYWESTYYNDFQGGRGQINVFEDPINFTNAWGDEMNGDGLLLYPGRDVIFPAEDRGFDGPMPSIRLKNWRRGIQDVDYLVLAVAAGHQDLVNDVVNTLVPHALDDGGLQSGDAAPWEQDGEVWLAQRRRLADVLVDVGEGGSGGSGSGGAGPGGSPPATTGGEADDDSGCGCRLAGRPAERATIAWLLGLGLVLRWRRRAGRRSRWAAARPMTRPDLRDC